VLSASRLVPQNLIYVLARGEGFREPPAAPILTRGLGDGTLRFTVDDVVTQKVRPV
jgi:hypothetical protein